MLPARYKLLTKSVVAGGFGSVVPVEDTFLRRVVLYKSMQDKQNNDQLVSEIRGLSKARSRHVIDIYDVVKDELGRVEGVVIERLRGRGFADFHREALANPGGYLRILYQVATALRDLHKAGVIHRDLKLDNFKESASGVVKLFDFGISSPDGGYQTTQNRGTVVYAAPELYASGATITNEMDVYAFGVCAWALAMPAFPNELLERPPQRSGRCPSLREVWRESGTRDKYLLDEDLLNTLDSCLDPDPVQRPSAATLSSLLERHLVRNQHRGLFVRGNAEMVELSRADPDVTIKIGKLGSLRVAYDGIFFRVQTVTGDVYINNRAVVPGIVLHESCLLTFGEYSLGPEREWVTFFASQPEVVL